jgi:acetyl-CoA synthase
MSKLVAFAAIQGGYKVVSKLKVYKKALETYNADTKSEFPNTAYYLPVIYSLTGHEGGDPGRFEKPLEFARGCCRRTSRARTTCPTWGPCWMPVWPLSSPMKSWKPCAT